IQNPLGNDSTPGQGNGLYGCLGQLYSLKLENRNLKLILLVSGYMYSHGTYAFGFLARNSSRGEFVRSAVQFIKDYGFDWLRVRPHTDMDIDTEFPTTAEEGNNLGDLVSSLRTAFNQLDGNSTSYQLSTAISADKNDITYLAVRQMNETLDFWNIMAYNYSGSWEKQADNQANLFPVMLARTMQSNNSYHGERLSIRSELVGRFCSANDTGIPLYGHTFENTDGIGKQYNSSVQRSSDSDRKQFFLTLPLRLGADIVENNTTVSSYSYDNSTWELVSYDTPGIVELKAKYIMDQALAGRMYWE
ncbi:glycoside hydrolase, partial [Mycena rosella]